MKDDESKYKEYVDAGNFKINMDITVILLL